MLQVYDFTGSFLMESLAGPKRVFSSPVDYGSRQARVRITYYLEVRRKNVTFPPLKEGYK